MLLVDVFAYTVYYICVFYLVVRPAVLIIGAAWLTTRGCFASWCVFALYALVLLLGASSLTVRLLYDLYAVVLRIGASSLTMCGCPAYRGVFALLNGAHSPAAQLFFAWWCAFAHHMQPFCLAARLRLLCGCFAYWRVLAYYARLICLLHLRSIYAVRSFCSFVRRLLCYLERPPLLLIGVSSLTMRWFCLLARLCSLI